MKIEAGDLLKSIQYPDDLRKLPKDKLFQVCKELREFLIHTVSVNGGHFAASLGVVELTVALHYVFNTPQDQIVWDVGHQAYGHKILTGRRDDFHTNRVYKGISGFPKRKESPYDTFGVGHSSTSISAALGMAEALKYQHDKRKVVAVIGDGSLTGGIAFEALNNMGVSDANALVILNDNCMSIDPNVGGLKEYLTDITTSPTYNRFRDEIWNLLGNFSKLGKSAQDLASKVEGALKGALLKESNLFESLGIRYFGPVDGHDINHLVEVLTDLKNISGPKILHIVTVKGKGFALAEKDQTKWHAPGLFDKVTGEIYKSPSSTPKPPKYQDVFGKTIIELAEKNEKIMGITPAMPSGCSLKFMMESMTERAFDVGICEQHAVTFAAGLATQGLVPFCNIYSSFMQRAYDQVIHDVALQNLHVVFCLDRGGLAGADGATHHGTFDLAYFRCIPNMVVAAPMDEPELRNMMYTFQLAKNAFPSSIRYPRGEGVTIDWQTPFVEIPIGKGRKIADGKEVAILTIGHVGNFVTEARHILSKQNIVPAHYDLRFVKPLDEALLREVFTNYDKVITVEDGCLMGGMGSAVLEFMTDNGFQAQVKRLGVPDRFIDHGSQEQLWAECNYDAQAIVQAVMAFSKEKAVV
ncbi:MAG: 1-deoxy-D-xylulose-5-phosphate synthase [Bacteroidetes bacterium]|nr:1-deoxy-D-xylulose-5-phosphate synthase [Bacteroidota bacterium]MCB9043715.1 1-deoxy-D-xylulose-5-phosphate synthase [Chitinophagales bacterium]